MHGTEFCPNSEIVIKKGELKTIYLHIWKFFNDIAFFFFFFFDIAFLKLYILGHLGDSVG